MSDHAYGYDGMTDEHLLEKATKGWNCAETPCGTGSTVRASAQVRTALAKIVADHDIRAVADAGAGDLNWMRLMRWEVAYRGYDLFPRHDGVMQLDITKQILPRADLILCRHVLNHLSVQYSERALANFKASGAKYLLMTMNDRQQDYWRQFGLERPVPIKTFDETGTWWLELSRL